MSYTAWCESFVVGEPVQTWLRPRFKVKGQRLVVRFTSINSDLPRWAARLLPFQAEFIISLPVNCETERDFHLIMRDALHELLKHEADEAVRVRGEKSFNPHYAEYQTPQSYGGGGGIDYGGVASMRGGSGGCDLSSVSESGGGGCSSCI